MQTPPFAYRRLILSSVISSCWANVMEHKNREELYATRNDSEHDAFAIQINCFDRYQATPTPFDRTEPPSAPPGSGYYYHHVPVVRVFGSLPTGHNILVHIHGAFPYLYIPWMREDPFELQLRLERVVAESLRHNKDNDDDENRGRGQEPDPKVFKYIAHVSICKGTKFYGYHVGHQLFFKIHLLNPSYLNRIADLLRDGHALGKKTDVFEAHIPFGLQFLTDFNLFGCGWLRLQDIYIRTPILFDDELKTPELVEYMMGFNTTVIPRIGRSALEIDTSVQYILNRLDLKERDLHKGFAEKLGLVELNDTVYIQSTKDLWKDSAYQRQIKGENPFSTPVDIVRDPTMSFVEAEENQKLFEYAKGMATKISNLDFGSFVKSSPLLDKYPTTFESITEMFYEPQYVIEDEEEEETTHGEIIEDEDDDAFREDYNADAQALENIRDEIEAEDDEVAELQEQVYEGADPAVPSLTEGNTTSFDVSAHSQFLKRMAVLKRTFSNAFPEPLQQPKLGPHASSTARHIYKNPPPMLLDFEEEGLPNIQYTDPFYMEAPPKPFVHAGKKFELKSKLLEYLPPVPINGEFTENTPITTSATVDPTPKSWKYTIKPPSYEDVEDHSYQRPRPMTQIDVKRTFKFATQKSIERRPDGSNNLTVFIAEVFVPTRGDLNPNPANDPIVAISWRFINGDLINEGLLCLQKSYTNKRLTIDVSIFDDELDMLNHLATLICSYDPDIIAGYEVHASSWGYIIDRGKVLHDFNFLSEISRVTFKSHSKMGDHWGYTHTSSIQVCGRHTINIWRTLKDLNLEKNSIEYVAYHLLHEKLPHFSYKSLTQMAETDFNTVVKHLMRRIDVDSKLLASAEVISRAAEQARLIGVDFNDVFYRGSQYKVESLMTRIAKAENFLMLSPSKKQVRDQKPLECIPMVMEPISQYYNSPLLVLDFQSLYPSIIIAYNYCYSTLLGRLKNYSEKVPNPIGAGKVKVPPELLKLLENDITLSPNGLMFAKSTVRKSLLAKMLADLLDTRVMVKSTMKFLDSSMEQLYNNRQLALKLTANVTYGYTSASFSGRMPCSDVADAIVQTGRETLERAIELIEGNESWGAKVVYGDTDSLFVYLPGRSREDAFVLGKQMAEAVTRSNPNPITLKFEKVYHPALLMAKKRYVGYSYEHLDSPAKFDAKGIETVRRDGHPALKHIVEHCLRTLFETNNITLVKKYLQDQFFKIMNNDVSIQDFCFARAVRVGTYKNPPPGAVVSEKKMAEDERAEPQYKERVPYVIIQEPNSLLRERARSPDDFIKNNHKLDSEYYITKTIIPPIERIFSLVGVDVHQWYNDMPRQKSKGSIYSVSCVSCGVQSKSKLCQACQREELQTVLNMKQKVKLEQERWRAIFSVCRSCTGDEAVHCESQDCSVYFTRVRQDKVLKELEETKMNVAKFLNW